MGEGAESDRWHGEAVSAADTGIAEIEKSSGLEELKLRSCGQALIDQSLVTLRGGDALLLIDAAMGQRPHIVYCGPDIAWADTAQFKALTSWQFVNGSASQERPLTLSNELATGTLSPPGLVVSRNGEDWALDLRTEQLLPLGDNGVQIQCRDNTSGVAATYNLALDAHTGVLTCSTEIENSGESDLSVDWCSGLCLPLDPRLTQIMGFAGRWSGEFQTEEISEFQGSYLRENRAGRTSHECFPGVILKAANTDELQGLACGFHLAWSGNHRSQVDRLPDGRSVLQMGELLLPGEVRLGAGENYRTPELLAAWSWEGVGAITKAFHAHLTSNILDQRTRNKPRPVHFNTWEAVYFDHDQDKIIKLAEMAASVGAERFVLDDGWFGSRRSDAAGLGDWWVTPELYPEGLHPIVNRVRALEMEFGLWFEPEMVNPDSDLYRAHPDWVLEARGVDPITFRNQLTLDLSKSEVADYLFDKIAALVDEYKIDYIKWDMNRDCHHPGSEGRAAMHRQTLGVYRLIDRLRGSFPKLEIESCASGGARTDYAILQRTDRIWTSDNNDARDRQHIQKGASFFFPLKVQGTHVGPKICHVTGRQFTMEFRVASAIFGHMGLELDLNLESKEDRAVLSRGIALYKEKRALLHNGDFRRVASQPHANIVGVVSKAQDEALFSYALLESRPRTAPDRLFFTGLDAARNYRVKIVWPLTDPSRSGLPSPRGIMSDNSPYDLLIIGGGINGAGIARDAAGRGLKVLLVEKNDLASHTSSASTKLIHGGLRYLEHFEFRLVRESLIERERLLKIAPHIVWPLRFVLPHDKGLRPKWLLRLGLFLYDNLGGRKLLPATKNVNLRAGSHAATLEDRLTSGFEYSDCWVEDSRLVVLNCMDAAERGATICTRTKCTGLKREAGQWIATLKTMAGEETVRAKTVINAAGPWVDDVLGKANKGASENNVRLVKGSHLIFPKLFDQAEAYIFQNKDDRIIFAIPYERDYTLVGTTDVLYQDDPAKVAISEAEKQYICDAANEYLRTDISPDQAVWDYSGVRPLYDDHKSDNSTVTRDYVFDLDEDEGASILSIFGGKITTYRKLAEHALEKLEISDGRSWTADEALPGGDFDPMRFDAVLADLQAQYPWVDQRMMHRLLRAYGTRVHALLDNITSVNGLGEHLGGDLYARELEYLCDAEFAQDADDVLWRRSKLGLHLDEAARAKVKSWFETRERAQ
uniref:Alpha galactosidase II n=1 Tax=Gracilariopsis lemaneiformis TaxID=2782 RepID=A0A291B0A8_GRALE|nr:alpha galactosidase II [Gracilariopsis lemaneiformis]